MSDFEPVQEGDRVDRGLILKIALASAVVMAASLAVVGALLPAPDRTPPPTAPATIGTLEQTLILSGQRAANVDADQRAKLERLEWVDRDAGLARIPIERAMDLVAADGGAP